MVFQLYVNCVDKYLLKYTVEISEEKEYNFNIPLVESFQAVFYSIRMISDSDYTSGNIAALRQNGEQLWLQKRQTL